MSGRADLRPERRPRAGARPDRRAQSSIIGVAVLVTVTALSVGALTMAAGTFVEDGVAAANSQRVADDLAGIDTHGSGVANVEFSRGTLRVEPRTARLLRNERVVATVDVDALVYESRGRRVAYLGGVTVTGRHDRARVRGSPPVVAGDGRLLVDLVALNASGPSAVGGTHPVTVRVRTNATHAYRALREGRYAVAVETTTPRAWERAFDAAGMEHARHDYDDDGVPSVVASVPEPVTVDLAVHDLQAVVRRG